ncbi:hypothetical protein CEUSTIGMA_g13600.t1 [Chlamydomonas eustigma]|uniref:Uncharacterized protein n=1 Tax=Chlamydomonas eustigma TaxID=1157962 RepID=A0A250XSZ1_9CHLO|nr:hypothetical protein CEUSTIGMA_g13600.t1 [Chlamydomonas eustigma]|eukprot:GAX86187.1 hypothetical protein CEUSTIGMA_g13600.t1 [Chlamydomonas eustigma]
MQTTGGQPTPIEQAAADDFVVDQTPETNLMGGKRKRTSTSTPPEQFEREMLEKICRDRHSTTVGVGSYWTGVGLTLEAQYRTVPTAASNSSLYFGPGQKNPTRWWIKLEPGSATCALCNNEKIKIKDSSLDSIRQHACAVGHVSNLFNARLAAKDGMKSMLESLTQDIESVLPPYNSAHRVSNTTVRSDTANLPAGERLKLMYDQLSELSSPVAAGQQGTENDVSKTAATLQRGLHEMINVMTPYAKKKDGKGALLDGHVTEPLTDGKINVTIKAAQAGASISSAWNRSLDATMDRSVRNPMLFSDDEPSGGNVLNSQQLAWPLHQGTAPEQGENFNLARAERNLGKFQITGLDNVLMPYDREEQCMWCLQDHSFLSCCCVTSNASAPNTMRNPAKRLVSRLSAKKVLLICHALKCCKASSIKLSNLTRAREEALEGCMSYDFEAEWECVLRIHQNNGRRLCPGVPCNAPKVTSVYPQGMPSHSALITAIQAPQQAHSVVNNVKHFPGAQRLLRDALYDTSTNQPHSSLPYTVTEICRKYGIFQYTCEERCLRSSFCLLSTFKFSSTSKSSGHDMCEQCEQLQHDLNPSTFVEATSIQDAAQRANFRFMSGPHLQSRLESTAKQAETATISKQRETRKVVKEKASRLALVEEIKSKLRSGDGSELVNLVQRAVDEGLMEDHAALKDILLDCFKAITGGRQTRHLSPVTLEFFVAVLQHSGQQMHDFVSKTFLGPAISTTRHIKAVTDYPCVLGLHPQFFTVAAKLINDWGLSDAPFVLSEDGSALQMRVDICSTGGDAHVFGFSGGSTIVRSVEEFKALARERTIASTLYSYTLVPLVDGAPSFPLFSFAHDNSSSTFSTQLAWDLWKYIWQELHRLNIKLIGHTHDGDRRLVNLAHQVCRYDPDGNDCDKELLGISQTSLTQRPAPIGLDHPVLPPFQIFAQNSGIDTFIYILDVVDWMHAMWRVKTQFLQPHRRLDFGGLLILPSFLQMNKEALGLSDADLDHTNKQDMRGMEKVQ